MPEKVREVKLAAESVSWVGRGKATQRAVLFAHIAKAMDCCHNPYGAAEREMAERAKIQCRDTCAMHNRNSSKQVGYLRWRWVMV